MRATPRSANAWRRICSSALAVATLATSLIVGREIRSGWALEATRPETARAPREAATDPKQAKPPAELRRAIFAGGCFWCMEPPFDALDGVVKTTSGYAGGTIENPSYDQVSAGGTGHTEVVEVVYDPGLVSYQKLLDVFWHNVDPTTPDRQFCDRGSQYRTAIFVTDEEQRAAAESSKKALETSGKLPGKVVTEIASAGQFYPAEEYHQDYYRKNPIRYQFYRRGCGRDARLKEIWGEAAGSH